MRKVNPLNPWNDVPGFWGAFGRVLWRITGPAQVGIGRPEEPYVPPADPRCPMCGEPMAEHEIERGAGTTPTRLHCPTRG
ncbi:hypothetical protein [Microcella alkalica]|uniref:hypothetical protein n=1 Tax=Microcella alkalica TaxID=355930 RepID=UPI002948BDA2|nr:hypothetical protein [Microcella alkalica]